jgi:hypothetical protein
LGDAQGVLVETRFDMPVEFWPSGDKVTLNIGNRCGGRMGDSHATTACSLDGRFQFLTQEPGELSSSGVSNVSALIATGVIDAIAQRDHLAHVEQHHEIRDARRPDWTTSIRRWVSVMHHPLI